MPRPSSAMMYDNHDYMNMPRLVNPNVPYDGQQGLAEKLVSI